MAMNPHSRFNLEPARAALTNSRVLIFSERCGEAKRVMAVPNSFHGRSGLDLRVYFTIQDGVFQPGNQGIRLNQTELQPLKLGLSELLRLGLSHA